MLPKGKSAALFKAFSSINMQAFESTRLLSCPNLSKAPNYGEVLDNYLAGANIKPARPGSFLAMCIRYLAVNIGHYLHMLLGLAFITILRWKKPEGLYSGKVLVLDTFALLHPIAGQERYLEHYLPALAETAGEFGWQPVRLYRLYGPRSPLLLWRALAVLARESRGGNGEAARSPGITEMHLLTWTDWLRMIGHILAYPFDLFRLIRSLNRQATSGGASPEAYIRDALGRTFGQCALTGEARRLAGYRLGLLLAVNGRAKICSWFENQTVDKCFQHGLKAARLRSGRLIPATGAQLFTWPDTLLNNHADDREITFGLTPDKVLVNGPHFLPDKTRQKYGLGPSLRYRSLFEEDVKSPGLNDPLLVILSYHPAETRRILKLVQPLTDAGQSLVFRFHPATKPEDFKDVLPEALQEAHGNLYKALKGKGAAIGAGSGALAEAVCLGLPTLSVRCSEADLQYLPDFGKERLWDEVRGVEDIQSSLEKLRAFRVSNDYEATRLAFRNLLFTEPSKENIVKAFELDE